MIPEDGLYLSLWRGLIPAPGRPAWRGPCGYLHLPPHIVTEALERVQAELGVTPHEVLSGCRTRRVSKGRWMAMYILRSEHREGVHKYSFPAIGAALGVDHTSVMHGVKRHKQIMAAAAPALLRAA